MLLTFPPLVPLPLTHVNRALLKVTVQRPALVRVYLVLNINSVQTEIAAIQHQPLPTWRAIATGRSLSARQHKVRCFACDTCSAEWGSL
jgi:hypothetical protein